MDPLKVDARHSVHDKYGKEIVWPKSRAEWLAFDMNRLKPGTEMPANFKTETPPDKYIVNGLLQLDLVPKEERWRYRLPTSIEEPEVPRNADGTIIIVDEKQKQIERLTEHLALMTKQINTLTSEIKSQQK
jgi:hypothetical protein